ncbi:MAG: four helix bundle protein [Planctomycetaceae bacterium]|jgi:four helix bundle protein|nr:four helix bundle protein [Planctomycetaceae bacterium]
MSKSILRDKSYAFSIRIINMSKYLSDEKNEHVLRKQILRSGTAIGALVREAGQAESNADFVHKLSVALKEAHETDYWLSLLKDTKYITEEMFRSIIADCEELIKLLTSSIKTAKSK